MKGICSQKVRVVALSLLVLASLLLGTKYFLPHAVYSTQAVVLVYFCCEGKRVLVTFFPSSWCNFNRKTVDNFPDLSPAAF